MLCSSHHLAFFPSYHDIPWVGGGDGPPHLQHHAGEQEVEAPNAVLALVVGGDANVDVSHGGVSVAESDHRDVAQGSFVCWLHPRYDYRRVRM